MPLGRLAYLDPDFAALPVEIDIAFAEAVEGTVVPVVRNRSTGEVAFEFEWRNGA